MDSSSVSPVTVAPVSVSPVAVSPVSPVAVSPVAVVSVSPVSPVPVDVDVVDVVDVDVEDAMMDSRSWNLSPDECSVRHKETLRRELLTFAYKFITDPSEEALYNYLDRFRHRLLQFDLPGTFDENLLEDKSIFQLLKENAFYLFPQLHYLGFPQLAGSFGPCIEDIACALTKKARGFMLEDFVFEMFPEPVFVTIIHAREIIPLSPLCRIEGGLYIDLRANRLFTESIERILAHEDVDRRWRLAIYIELIMSY